MALKIGDKAPDFIVNDQDGHPVRLSDLKGKKVIIYFYPKDMTPGCTAEACNLRDNFNAMQKHGFEILGVSTDSEKSHRKFIDKEKLPFRLLSDTTRVMHESYGTWVEKSMYGRNYMGTARVTFVINNEGIIEDIIQKVDTKNHAAQILKNGLINNPKLVVKETSVKPAKKRTTSVASKTSTKKAKVKVEKKKK
jgi:thioredoxin-dependent peroxiredoxin